MTGLSYSEQVERVLWSWPAVVEKAETDWARDFARSIAAQARRRNWRPSPKQLALMQQMVGQLYRGRDFTDGQRIADPFPPDDDFPLIED